MSLKIQFLGAAETVTGSSYLVTTSKSRFIVDCGLFQGRDVEYRNYENFEFDPRTIDFVIVTHAHIDHIGLLPKLVKGGFAGPIYLTGKTAALSYHLLLDAAKIQEKNYARKLSPHMLYDTTDSLKTIQLFESRNYDEPISTENNIEIVFEEVGHVLGAASVKVKVDEKTIYFSGDIGREKHPFLRSFDKRERSAEVVIMEALYGGQVHPDRDKTEQEFLEYIILTLARGGNVIIPAFALQRTQEILNILRRVYTDRRIGVFPPVFLDSPLAISMTNEYTQSMFANDESGSELFDFEKVRYIMRPSKAIKRTKGPKIIIAGSGMCEGGRIMGHLIRNLPDPKNGIAIVGFQAEDTLGRTLTEEPDEVTINKKKVRIRAEIKQFYGFSAHGDTNDIQAWLNRFDKKKLEKVFLVHAEPERMEKFDEINANKPIYIPKWKEEVEV
ncbi:MBL fold metallo-hydrolase [Candidatus Dojkabacteria bacterium]|nr:MBL fold metallo-hydrolase [Candidatus Dojkabacteria bacterium]